MQCERGPLAQGTRPAHERSPRQRRESSATARLFVFSGSNESLAASKCFTADMGIISASFYPEEINPKEARGIRVDD